MNFVLGPEHPLYPRNNLTARATNYDQDYTTGGTVTYSPSTDYFSVKWDTTDDFVVGVGWNPGGTEPITYSGSFTVSSGLGSLSVYGWSTNPLVEYYVMEDNVGITVGGTQKGTFESDGGTYTVWETTRTNEPSIEGTATFNQYISIRTSPRTSGTVTIQNHFEYWYALGLKLGTLNYQVVAVESWDGVGSAAQSVNN
ncbi:concanavalin A-like lectin/glucanase domain-containing protein [Xylariales sp. PMI_506]|nr:concanavalin A-like lectin/glucanase domain-containing protein [Xylariales sp. PMI_506]